MPVRLADVARAAGVSVTTASRALNNADHPMAETTRRAVLDAARRLGYHPNLVARSLRTEQTLTIGIVVENILSPFIAPITRGIQDYLDQHNYLSIIINADWDPEIETRAIERLNRRQIDGIVFVESCIRSSEEAPALVDKPHVFVHRLFNSLCPCSVVHDDRHGATLAVEHLVAQGHRRIAFISGPEDWDATVRRFKGYQDQLAVSGIAFDPDLVRRGNWQVRSGYTAARELLRLTHPPTAIFAANDHMALGVIHAARETGMQVPADLAVVGYDDREFASFVWPTITTVRMPCATMGRTSAEILLGLINGDALCPEPLLIPGQLIIRQSSGGACGPWDPGPERADVSSERADVSSERADVSSERADVSQ